MEWFELFSFIGGVIVAVVGMIIKDAIQKNTFQHKLEAMDKAMQAQEMVNKAQESRITNNREALLEMKTTMLNLRERFDDFYQLQKEEVKSIQVTLNESNQRFASLDATLKGLTKWLERVEHKLEAQ